MARLLAAGLLAVTPAANATLLGFCDQPAEIKARHKDHLLRFGAVIRTALEASGDSVALIARSGLDMTRFGVRYTHAGISLKDSPTNPWAVRQLYFACAEGRPRIFDQGLSAFLLGLADPSLGYVSVLLLPARQASEVAQTALDTRLALQLLNPDYSANAYPFSDRFQNCNQWVAELLARAWGNLSDKTAVRTQAQSWLRDNGYQPTEFQVQFPPLSWLASIVSWIRLEDHPPQNLNSGRLQVSMPASIEQFVRLKVPQAQRLEFCHDGRRIVVRRGWEPIAEGCVPSDSDQVVALD